MPSSSDFTLRFMRLDPAACLPAKAHADDLGWDLAALAAQSLAPGEITRIRTGIAVEFPPGVGGVVKDRSSTASRGLHALAGVIDPGYRGEILVVAVNLGRQPLAVAAGERFAQMLLVQALPARAEEVRRLAETARGGAGFGSTGA